MPTPNPPSLIFGSASSPPAADAAIQQDAAFNAGGPIGSSIYRTYVDSQIRGLESHVVQSLTGGLTGTWVQVDPNSAAVAKGQWVCMAGSVAQTVTPALLAALVLAGQPLGIALTAGGPGAWIRVALEGIAPPSVTGIVLPASLFACVNTATGFTQTKTSLGSNDYPVGTVDAAANLTVHIQLAPVAGVAGGGLSVAGSGFIPVANGVIGGTARAVNLAANTGLAPDVINLLPWLNGGRWQGVLNVVNGVPGTLSLTVQIAYCDSTTGTTQVTLPASPSADLVVLVLDTGGVAATSAITVVPSGRSIWDPTTQTFITGNVTLSANGGGALWQWDAVKTHWVLLNSVGSASGGGTASQLPVSTSGGVLVMTALTSSWVLFVANDVITLPSPLIAGKLYEFTHDLQRSAVSLEGGQVTFQRPGGATYTIEDPQNRAAVPAASVSGRTDGATYRFKFDGGSIFRCVGIS